MSTIQAILAGSERVKVVLERLKGVLERLNGVLERLNGVLERLNGELERLNGSSVRSPSRDFPYFSIKVITRRFLITL